MKKIILLVFVYIATSLLTYTCLNFYIKNNKKPDLPKKSSKIAKKIDFSDEDKSSSSSSYFGSKYKGNYIWGGAMNLAWNELNENILHEKLQIASSDEAALQMVEGFNNPVFTKKDLDEKSYYVKSGFGQKTVTQINTESKIKFPSKTIPDLDIQLNDPDIISYAYFLKEIEYVNAFAKADMDFQNIKIKGFKASEDGQRDVINIVKYWNNDKFIVSLNLKDNSDQIFLSKGFDMNDPKIVVDEINKYKQEVWKKMTAIDSFSAPIINLDYLREYNEIIGKPLANKKFTDYKISKMFEAFKFKMDEKGARVENEGVITMKNLAMVDTKNAKILHLDKPYWIVMKRTESKNPYFILGINNTELMTKATSSNP